MPVLVVIIIAEKMDFVSLFSLCWLMIGWLACDGEMFSVVNDGLRTNRYLQSPNSLLCLVPNVIWDLVSFLVLFPVTCNSQIKIPIDSHIYITFSIYY